jgi:UDP-2,4-diacetamido-2,4,6-trideoxy-beta-L-altropyranose hydrolase
MRSLNRPASWLIVDHYGLDRRWEERLRPLVKSILVIDDLADRPHDCDLLLDQNLGGDRAGRYDKLVPARCRRLIGPRYALLRREFRDARAGLRGRDGSLRRILVFFGGSDPSGETLKTLDALTVLNRKDLAVDVVVGASNPRQDEVRSRCAALPNTAFHSQISTMAALMAQADLAVGAGGTANWERCFLGLPAITIIIAGNQQASTDALAAAGAVRNLGRSEDVTRDHIAAALNEMIASPALLRGMSERAFAVMGEADRTEDRALIDMLTGGEHGAS